MKAKLASIIAALLCTSCGTYQLGYVKAQRGQTQEQLQLDMLTCKDEAHNAANSADRQAGAFLLGMTIVGAPLAVELEKKKSREVYGSCIQARGYEYTPPTDGSSSAPQRISTAPTTVSGKDGLFKITLPAGWTQTTLPNAAADPSVQLAAKNPTADAYLLIGSVNASDIQDWQIYAESLRTKVTSNLTQSTSSEIQKVKVNGFDALRADIGGTLKNGVKVHYLGTVIKTDKNIVYLLAWSLESKFAMNRSEFEQLASAMQF